MTHKDFLIAFIDEFNRVQNRRMFAVPRVGDLVDLGDCVLNVNLVLWSPSQRRLSSYGLTSGVEVIVRGIDVNV